MDGEKALEYALKCPRCGRVYSGFRVMCECGTPLTVEFHVEGSFDDLIQNNYLDVRRYLRLLPVEDKYTPRILYPITPIIERKINGHVVLFKLDYLMPSGSFKDRGTFLALSALKREGIRNIVIDSSGNAGISFALYGSTEGLEVHVYIPENTPEGKKSILKLLGARIHLVKGDRNETHRVARESSLGVYVGHWYNPFFLEGIKTLSFEVYEQVGDIDSFIAPVGSGTLLLGTYKGFCMLRDLGALERMPTMIAVQAHGYESVCPKSSKMSSLADGIAIKNPPRRDEIKAAISRTGGTCVSVSDYDIKSALAELMSMGFLVEPTSAVAYAGFKKLVRDEALEEKSKVLVPLTGSGMKLLDKLIRVLREKK